MTRMTPTATPAKSDTRPLESEPARLPLREAPQAAPISEETYRETLDFVTPRPAEMKWASIPWQTDLWEARKIAAKQGKPIFAWMMNGNPLGCV